MAPKGAKFSMFVIGISISAMSTIECGAAAFYVFLNRSESINNLCHIIP